MTDYATSEHSAAGHPASEGSASEQQASGHPTSERSPSEPRTSEPRTPGQSAQIEQTAKAEVSWHDIHIAGRQFNIASRKGVEHVRAVEQLIGETVTEIEDLLDGQGPANTALLIALNLADQLLAIRTGEQNKGADSALRLQELVSKLSSSLDIRGGSSDHKKGENSAAMYEKLEFF